MKSTHSAWIGVVTAIFVPVWVAITAVPASAQRSDRGGEVVGTASPAPASAPASAPAPASSSSAPSSASPASSDPGSVRSGGGSAPSSSTGRRPRDGEVVGTAVPRGSVPIDTGGSVVFVPAYGFYPWGWGGLGFGGYYGGFYDPWYAGGYPTTYYPVAQNRDEGALRLKVKPREASVYTDGYFVGKVDDFDGVLQKLHLSAGPHRIEIRDPKYETLMFDVRIETDETVTYRGEMKKIQ
jgi:hypothetical protein